MFKRSTGKGGRFIAKNELSVITKAKDLCSYIMTVTDKSPKRFRFTLVSRLQNYALDVIENLIMANETFVSVGDMRAAAGKRDKRDVIDFELDLSRNLWEIIHQMEDKTYRVGGYHKFMIYDPKERKIEALSFRDRVVQHCQCDNILKPFFENRLIYDNAACREGKGTDFARDRLTGFLREHYKKHGTKGYILKYDIRHYFDSIDHEILKGMLKDIPDRNVLGLLYHIIRSYEGATDSGMGRKKGLPLGNQTSQWFALYYLDSMDRLIKEKMRIKYYVRYMDDGVLVHESKEYLNKVLCQMKEKAKELNLEFNQKTQIMPISEGVDFLGFRFYLTDTGKVIRRLRTSNKRRWKRRLKKYKEEYRTHNKSLEKIGRSVASYNGHLAHDDDGNIIYQDGLMSGNYEANWSSPGEIKYVGKDYFYKGDFLYTGDIKPEIKATNDGYEIWFGDDHIPVREGTAHGPAIAYLPDDTIGGDKVSNYVPIVPHAHARYKVEDYCYQISDCEFKILPNNSLIEISKDKEEYHAGDDAQIRLMLTGQQYGEMHVFVNEKVYRFEGGGEHIIDLTDLKEGKYNIEAVGGGDDYVTGFSTKTSFEVTKKDPVLTLTAKTPAGGALSDGDSVQYHPESPIIVNAINDENAPDPPGNGRFPIRVQQRSLKQRTSAVRMEKTVRISI